MKYIIIRFKKLLIPLIIYMFTIFLILFSSNNLDAAKNGLILWAIYIVPSMFPFFIATELLSYTNIISFFGKLLNKVMKPIFNLPGSCAFPLIMGFISGYPVGAKIVSNFKKQGICTQIECERLLSFTNNSGPLFIIGTVGINLFNSQSIGFKLLFVHIISSLLVGFLFRFWKNKKEDTWFANNKKSKPFKAQQNSITLYNLGEVLSTSIQSAINSTLIIGGFVIFFSVIVSMLTSSQIINIFSNLINPILVLFKIPSFLSKGLIIGLLEVTNGLKSIAIPGNRISITLCSFLLGLGGLSIFFQILSITSKEKLSIKPYIIGKILQASFSAIIMWFLLAP